MSKKQYMPLPQSVETAIQRLEQAGFACYAVGGCVRDWLLGKQPHDYDLCTAATPEQTMQAFAGEKVLEIGLKHGTVTVLLQGDPIEITTFRTESAYSDGRRPDSVAFVSDIEQDLARRDFTINAMAWSPLHGLCDPFGGQADLRTRKICCVGDPQERLSEDALRILRALRFASVLGFSIETHTAQALHNLKEQLCHVSSERITAELMRMLCGKAVGAVLMEYADIITAILPELSPMVGFEQHNPHHKYTVWEHSVRAVEGIRPDDVLRLVMLFHDVGKPAAYSVDERGIGHFYGHPKYSYDLTKQALSKLRLSGAQEERLLYLVRHHDTPLGSTQKHVRRKLAVHGEEMFRDLIAVKKADCIGQGTAPGNLTQLLNTEQLLEQVLEEQSCLTRRDLALNGYDLIEMGIHGEAIGTYLAAMLNYVLDDPSRNTKQQLTAFLQQNEPHIMEFTVNGMSAAYCAKQVRKLLLDIPHVARAKVCLDSGCAVIQCEKKISWEQVHDVLTTAGYEVVI